jgi:hypothetical protein
MRVRVLGGVALSVVVLAGMGLAELPRSVAVAAAEGGAAGSVAEAVSSASVGGGGQAVGTAGPGDDGRVEVVDNSDGSKTMRVGLSSRGKSGSGSEGEVL